MATISSIGIGSGLNVNDIISKLVDIEKQPLQQLQAKATSIQARLSSFGTIQSQFSALNDVLQRISAPAVWKGTTASSSNTNAATITATSTTPPTSFSLDVDQLAQAQSVVSGGIAKDSAVGSGTLTLRMGSWDSGGNTFTPASGSSDIAIAVTATDTVSDIAAKINAANAGVTATALNDGAQDRLVITSNATGSTGGFRIQATDGDGTNTDDTGLSRLAFDPATLNPVTNARLGMAASGLPMQYGQDAKARINGIAITSHTNTLDNNIPGVTINLLATTTTGYGTPGETKAPVTMAVKTDTSLATKNVQDFVQAYNALNQTLSDMTKCDASSQTAGPFQGDAVIVGLQNMTRRIIGASNSSGSAYQHLSDIGVSMQRDGSLSIDSVKLSAAINNGSELQKMFTATGSGFAVNFASFTSGALQSTGPPTNEAQALQNQLTANSKQQDKVNKNASTVEDRLRKQYSALDAQMGQLNALNAYVSQQVTLWNQNKNG